MAKIEHNFTDRSAWFKAIDSEPDAKWIDKRSLGNKSSKYIPIYIQQALADLFFDEVNIVEEKYIPIQNEILCTIKIQALPSYPDSEYEFFTGTGAKPIQMKSQSSVSDYPKNKHLNALEYCAPAARAAAISNALETYANIFGRNVARQNQSGFSIARAFVKKKKKSKKKKKDGNRD